MKYSIAGNESRRVRARMITFCSLLTCWVALTACSSEPQMVPYTGPHPALRPDQVDIYQRPPQKYQVVGVLEVPVTEKVRWDQRGESPAGFEAFKSQAAARGANGVLLYADSVKHDYRALVGYKGTFYEVPLRREPRIAVAQAIFVVAD